MRRRILTVAITAVLVAIVLLAAPLAVAVHLLYLTDEQGELERAALRAVVVVDPVLAKGDPVDIPQAEPDVRLGVYDTHGRLVAGTGPTDGGAVVTGAAAGEVEHGNEDGFLVAAVPVTSGGTVLGVVRAASPVSGVWLRTFLTWGLMVGIACVAIAVAVVVARRQARELSTPLEALAGAARSLGDGDFSVRTTRSGVEEIDDTGAALDVTAARLGELLERERAFSTNASHQLRTPLTALRLRLESALGPPRGDLVEAAQAAMVSADDLERTIEELLSLARSRSVGPTGPRVSADVVLHELATRWSGPLGAAGRTLVTRSELDSPTAVLSTAAVKQVLDVLVENALRHGTGVIEVVVREAGVAVAVDVRDEGSALSVESDIFTRGRSGDGGHGIGLALASDLARAQGGRLLLARTAPATVFTLLLPGDLPWPAPVAAP